MLNNDEFPYTKYFFDSNQILAVMKSVFPNGLEGLSDDAIAKEIADYGGYLEVHFRSDLKESLESKIKDKDLFFKFLFDEIDEKNLFYKEMLDSVEIAEPFHLLLETLIRVNCDLVNYIVPKYKSLVPFIKNNEGEIMEIVSKHSDENIWKGIFRAGKIFSEFKQYTKDYILDPYNDYSFLFQQMKYLNYIENIPHLVFAKWLKENGFISETAYNKIEVAKGFYSLDKSTSTQRLNNFNIVFGL